MTKLVLRRLLAAVPIILGVTFITFITLDLVPGDPAKNLLFGTPATKDDVARVRHELGLDRPLPVRYLQYLWRLVHGDLGRSYLNHVDVTTEIGNRLGSTFELTLAALLVALAIGVPAGIFAGRHPNTWIDRISTAGAVLGQAVPYFWTAMLLVLVFSVQLGWVPSLGTGGLPALILPGISLGWGFAAMLSRLLRAGVVTAYSEKYVEAARARGLSERRILGFTVLRNAAGPAIAGLGVQLGHMLAGAVAIEVIFGRAGLGSMLFNAITQKDIPTIQGGVLFLSLVYVVLNLLVDVLTAILDPRSRRESTSS